MTGLAKPAQSKEVSSRGSVARVRRTVRPAHGVRSATAGTNLRCSAEARGFTLWSRMMLEAPAELAELAGATVPVAEPSPVMGVTETRKRTPSPTGAVQVAGSSARAAWNQSWRPAPRGGSVTSTETLDGGWR